MSGYRYFHVPEEIEPEPERPRKRNARARWRLTPLGEQALAEYQKVVTTAQAGDGGRDALEQAQGSWATVHGVEPRDALVLDELRERPQTILELTRSLDTCGLKRPDVEAGIDRLNGQMFTEAVTNGRS